MKKILSLLAIVLTATTVAIGQAPGIFNYQGVARNSVGNVLVNKAITLRLTIHDGSAGGPTVYQESRAVTTNPFGLFNVQVGSPGTITSTGTVAGVPWGVGDKFIQVEIDPNGGTTFINIGTAQIASVPYSLYATSSGDLILPYLKTQADAGTLFRINNSGTGVSGAIMGTTSSNAANAWGVHGQVNNTAAGASSTGILGTNLSTTGNGIGVTGRQSGGGWGVYGFTPGGRGVFGESTTGIGLYGTTASGKALFTNGGVQLTGINEGLNRILVSDATGNGTWQNPSAVGVVTGSGTLNFVSKWTPNGTTLGNSIIFDNGTSVNIGTTTPDNAILLLSAATDPAIRIKNGTSLAVGGGVYLGPFANNDIYFGTNENTAIRMFTNGTQKATLLNNGNFGLGIVAPTARLHVTDGGTVAIGSFTKTNAANTANTVIVADADLTSTGFFNGGVFSSKGGGAATTVAGQAAVKGAARLAGGIGVAGATGPGGFAVAGGTSTGVALVGLATDPAGFALLTVGRVQIQGQGAGLNKILTSDAVGNATWQTLGGGVGIGGSGTLNFIPRWTPDGFNLGNSLMQDNASATSVSAPVDNDNTLTIGKSPASTESALLFDATGPDAAGIFLENATGKLHLTVNSDAAIGDKGLTIDDDAPTSDNTAVGIGTVSPSGKVHVVSDFNTAFAVPSIVPVKSAIVATQASTGGLSSGITGYADGGNVENYGIFGTSGGSANANFGGIFLAQTVSAGVNIGILSRASGGVNNFAGIFQGSVVISDGTEGAGKVFTSDAGGVGSWQSPSGAGLIGGGGTLDFIPKYTPDGVTIGNSRFFDDGAFTALGTTTNYDGQDIFNIEGSFTRSGITMRNDFSSNNIRGFINTRDGSIQGLQLGTISNNGIYFYTNNALKNVMDANGNLGLNVTIPTAKLDVAGSFKLANGTQAAGYILTSDAVGNASWQENTSLSVGISGRLLTGPMVVPSPAFVPVTNWTNLSEDGGANYNPGTGQYTITKSGVYQVSASVLFDPFTAPATQSYINLLVGVLTMFQGSDNDIAAGSYSNPKLSVAYRFTAGDVLQITVGQSSGVNQTINANYIANYFSIQFLHK